jgi:hypothetical protein
MPNKFGNTLDKDILKSPLTVGAPKGEKGPGVHNPPVLKPGDPLGFIPGGKGGKRK